MTLDPPTPLQWKALQECVVVHRNQLNNNDNNSTEGRDAMAMRSATIDAAPLVAIMDQESGIVGVKPPFSPHGEGRYATLAAIVGISISTSKKKTNENGNGNSNNDHDEEESFMEYMNLCPVDTIEDFIVPLSSSVRLVGIGRAVLRKYFYRVPSELCPDPNGDDENENENENDVADDDDADDDDADDDVDMETDDGYEDNTPIVMAEFEPLIDDASIYSKADPDKIGEKNQRSYRSSPVHALSELNNISIKVSWMHDDRRRLIAGIKAAKARLDLNARRRSGEIDYDDGLEDFDDIGALFVSKKRDAVADDDEDDAEKEGMILTIDELLATFQGNMMMSIDDSSAGELPLVDKMEAMENYGLSYFGAFSTIGELTEAALAQLKPYYSEKFREREEHDLEVSSFVAFRALDGYAVVQDMAWSLQCTSSVERLTRAYEILLDHRIQLKKLADKLSQELRECGEECTDLW